MSKEELIKNGTIDYDFDDPFVKTVIEEFNLDINNDDDLLELSTDIRSICVAYLLSNIQVKMLKKYWEGKTKRELSEDEVMTIAEAKHPFRIYSYTHKMNLDFHWTERATMYDDIKKIITINGLGTNLFTTRDQIALHCHLLNKDLSSIADYYACLLNVRQRRELMDMQVGEYIEKLFSKNKNPKDLGKPMVKK